MNCFFCKTNVLVEDAEVPYVVCESCIKRCSICDSELSPFHASYGDSNAVCKKCVKSKSSPAKEKSSSRETVLQKTFTNALKKPLIGEIIEMKRLTVYSNSARDKVLMFGDISIHFDKDGYGSTPDINRGKVERYMKQRPGRISIVEDVPKEVLEEAVEVAESTHTPEPEEVVVEEPVEVPEEVKVEAPVEPEPVPEPEVVEELPEPEEVKPAVTVKSTSTAKVAKKTTKKAAEKRTPKRRGRPKKEKVTEEDNG